MIAGTSVLKIALLAGDLSHKHGWAHHSLSLIEALRRAGANLTILASRNSPDVDGVTVHKVLPNLVPMERFFLLKQLLALPSARALVAGCDVIHSTVEPFAPMAAWLAGGRLYIVTGHGTYVQMADFRRFPASAVYSRALSRSQLVCISGYTAKVARASLPGVQTHVVNNGVDVGIYMNVTPKSPHTADGKKIVLAVGAVKPRKGTLELVRAMVDVHAQLPDVACVVVGSLDIDPGYVARVHAEIERLNLGDCVRLLGHTPQADLLDWYANADVFVLPAMNDKNKFEGFGLVYLEAGAAGLPVIGTTDNGAEDAIDDGITGLLVPQNQVAERLPGAILQLLNDAALAAHMGAAGRAKASSQTWDHVAQQMLKLYAEYT